MGGGKVNDWELSFEVRAYYDMGDLITGTWVFG